MSLYAGLWIISFWFVIYIVHSFLLECTLTSATYAKILSQNNMSINIFQLKWYTVKCNRLFIRLSNWRPNFLKAWFNIGVICGLIGQILSVFVLMYTLYDSVAKKTNPNEKVLVPVLPGVNLPSDQKIFYFIALLICGILHEFGHAIAASREQVRVNGFGVFVMFIFPGAYVDLCSDHLQIISPLRQLRIFCAGVWHNIILVVIALGILQLHPFFIGIFFDKNAYIGSIRKDTTLDSLLSVNSIITKIDTCEVKDAYTFYKCLYEKEVNNHSSGYCMSINEIQRLSSNYITQKITGNNILECCNELNTTLSNYCFNWNRADVNYFSCLPARYTTEKKTCVSLLECDSGISMKAACVRPIANNVTMLTKISYDKGKPILYVGSVNEIIYSIKIDEYMPKFAFIPRFLNYQLLILLKYIVAFSGAIGLLNLVPCFALDGQYILAAVLNLIGRRREKNSFIDLANNKTSYPILFTLIMSFGSLLLLLNVIIALYNLVNS